MDLLKLKKEYYKYFSTTKILEAVKQDGCSLQDPDKVLKEMIKQFSKTTNNLAKLSLLPSENFGMTISTLKTDFSFRIILTSDYLQGYSFKIFDLCYNVTIYPVFILLEEEIAEELDILSNYENDYIIEFKNEDDFKSGIKKIFDSNSFKTIVSGLMKIARAKQEKALKQKN